jgi:hypothetical protein
VFQRFGQAKVTNSGLILGLSQFLLLPQLPQKMEIASKMFKSDPKIIRDMNSDMHCCKSVILLVDIGILLEIGKR